MSAGVMGIGNTFFCGEPAISTTFGGIVHDAISLTFTAIAACTLSNDACASRMVLLSSERLSSSACTVRLRFRRLVSTSCVLVRCEPSVCRSGVLGASACIGVYLVLGWLYDGTTP